MSLQLEHILMVIPVAVSEHPQLPAPVGQEVWLEHRPRHADWAIPRERNTQAWLHEIN
eukprot:COSAG01_NODE_741_length_13888_cov_119.430996_4_plen_58_part_00